MGLSRRSFLVFGGMALGAFAAVPAWAGRHRAPSRLAAAATTKTRRRMGSKTIWRLTVSGRRTSTAAKEFCANMRFATRNAALLHPLPHPGINADAVPLDASLEEFWRLFIRRRRLSADLRQLGGPAS